MRVLSLFSGGGLGDYGLELAGMEIVGQVEIDEYCQKILQLRWPDVPKWRDIREVKGGEVVAKVGRVDLISGGFPCQDISQAKTSEQKGLAGERSGLWFEYLRLLREIRPRYVLVENTAALTYRGLGTVLGGLAESRYDAEWCNIQASWFGAPHLRERTFILAHTHGDRLLLSVPHRRPEKETWGKKTFWGQYWDEVRAGFTGFETIPPLEEAKREALDKPWLCRVVDGPAETMERLKLLGNGQVVQVVEWIGRRILEADRRMNETSPV